MRILIFGGTFEAVELANALVERGHQVTTSLAGRTQEPAVPKGKLLTGGFGGVEGIVDYLKKSRTEHVLDASHPFAANISANVATACHTANVDLIRIDRPPFEEPTRSHWIRVNSSADAAEQLPIGAKVFLTLGRQTLEPFIARPDIHYVLRAIEQPQMELPGNFEVVLARPPFSRASELALMRQERITHLVAKDSGGEMTAAKLQAAYMLNVQVIMINRPGKPEVKSVTTIADVLGHFDQFPAPKRRFFFFP